MARPVVANGASNGGASSDGGSGSCADGGGGGGGARSSPRGGGARSSPRGGGGRSSSRGGDFDLDDADPDADDEKQLLGNLRALSSGMLNLESRHKLRGRISAVRGDVRRLDHDLRAQIVDTHTSFGNSLDQLHAEVDAARGAAASAQSRSGALEALVKMLAAELKQQRRESEALRGAVAALQAASADRGRGGRGGDGRAGGGGGGGGGSAGGGGGGLAAWTVAGGCGRAEAADSDKLDALLGNF